MIHRWAVHFFLFTVVCFGKFCLGWHAFMGQEAVPTIAGTNLESSLVLPNTEFSATLLSPDNCSVVLTSLRKLSLGSSCFWGQDSCSLQCATAWESLLRDFRDASSHFNDTACQQTLLQIKSWIPDANLSTSPSDWDAVGQALSQLCMATEIYRCSSSYCILSYLPPSSCSTRKTALVRPTDCPTFTATDGLYFTPFLTWIALEYYEKQSIGGSGGLNLEADEEHGTWACVYVPQCGLVPNDLTCFQYSSVRGEFHFWGYNSVLKLHPSISDVELSFCSSDGILRIARADTANPVSTADVTFAWLIDGQTMYAADLFNLGPRGCNGFKLAKDRPWVLSADKPGFYLWEGAYKVSADTSVVSVPLQPVMKTASGTGLSVVLSWRYGGYDFDLWLVVYSEDWLGLNPQDDGKFAVNWINTHASVADGCSGVNCEVGKIEYGKDVTDGFGPESLTISGSLPDGSYSVYVNLYGANFDADVQAQAAYGPLVEIYSEQEGEQVLRLQAGVDTTGRPAAGGYWWHVLDLEVKTDAAQGSKCVVARPVDAFVASGYQVNKAAATVDGALDRAVGQANASALQCTWRSGKTDGFQRVLLQARSSLDADALIPAAHFRIVPQATRGPTAPVETDGPARLVFGDYVVTVQAEGYIGHTEALTVGADTPALRTVFLIALRADDSLIYFSLRWPAAPARLDLVVMPLGMAASWVDQDQRPVGDERSVARAYAGRDVASVSWFNESTGTTMTVIGRDRLEGSHGQGGLDGPQVVSIRSAVAGQYRVYVAIPPLTACSPPTTGGRDPSVDPVLDAGDDVELDVYFGNRLQQTVRLDRSGGKWWYPGYLFVGEGNEAEPEWVTVQQILLLDPLTMFYGRVQLEVVDAVSFSPATDFSAVTYTAYVGGLCECPVGTWACNCFGETPASGRVGPDASPCDTTAACEEDPVWQQGDANALYLPRQRSVYLIKVRVAGYADRVVAADAWLSSVTRVVMVPLPRAGELRVVLSWGAMPLDLDLWAIPAGDIASYTYWASRGPHSGVRLDTDARDGQGPESITFSADALGGVYRIAVNVYSSNGETECAGMANNLSLATVRAASMNKCEFQGGELVEFFGSRGLERRAVMDPPRPGSSWWLAGTVTLRDGGYRFEGDGENTKTTCAALMTDEAGVCRGDYCCNTCNSNCGECGAACQATVQVQLILTDAVAFDWTTDYSNAQYVIFDGPCQCFEGTPTCNCSGELVAAGEVGFDLTPCRRPTSLARGSCPDAWWTFAFIMPQGPEDAAYGLLLRKAGYVDRAAALPAGADGLLRVVMVPRTPPGQLLAVLTWAAAPKDLDLWLAPLDGRANATFWDARGPTRGAVLFRDQVDGFGPESIALLPAAGGQLVSDYTLAVNVYSGSGEGRCGGANVCRFAGGEVVELFLGQGLWRRFVLAAPGGSWWAVTGIRRMGSGYLLDPSIVTPVPSTTCRSVLRPPLTGGKCPATNYCCDACTSLCDCLC